MTELHEFETDTRAWLKENAPAALHGMLGDNAATVWGGKREKFTVPDSKRWLEVMAARGFTAPTWPKEYGGGGLSKPQARVLQRLLAELRIPPPLVGFGLNMIGPTLLQYGSDTLKAEHLPKICRGEVRWCQGYSEPGAGSDLANVQTSAVVDGDDYILNGQKVWTSYGDLSDWMFMIARTDPAAKKQAGITFMLVDCASPGVTIRPIKLISGASPFCETFFSDVRVARTNVVGDVNGGWTVAKALLGHERNMIAESFGNAGARGQTRNPLIDLAFEYVGKHEDRVKDPVLRDRLAQLMMDHSAFLLTVQRSADGAKAGHRPGAESSLFKIYGTELNQHREELGLSIRGPQATGWDEPGFTAEEAQKTRDWLRSRGNSIEGGTSEVQLNIIAKRVLGLPD